MKISKYLPALVLGLAFLLVAGVALAFTFHTSVQTCVVEDRDRTRDKDGNSDQRIYTSCGNFQVSDSLVHGKFSSSDTYRELRPGRTYEIKSTGFRVAVLSAFPNVIEAREVSR